MEVILTQDVPKLGARGAVVRVKDGYARNYLIPRRLALRATDANKRHFEEVMRQTRARMLKQRASAEELFAKLNGEHVKLSLAFGETGKAYGSVTAKEIAESFRQKGIYFDHHQVMLDRPIKEAGAHEVEIRLFEDVVAKVKVWVVPEGEGEPEAAAKTDEMETEAAESPEPQPAHQEQEKQEESEPSQAEES